MSISQHTSPLAQWSLPSPCRRSLTKSPSYFAPSAHVCTPSKSTTFPLNLRRGHFEKMPHNNMRRCQNIPLLSFIHITPNYLLQTLLSESNWFWCTCNLLPPAAPPPPPTTPTPQVSLAVLFPNYFISQHFSGSSGSDCWWWLPWQQPHSKVASQRKLLLECAQNECHSLCSLLSPSPLPQSAIPSLYKKYKLSLQYYSFTHVSFIL